MALIVRYVLCVALTLPLISAEDKVLTFRQQLHYIIAKMMPNLNSSCVAEGCPELKTKALCPRFDDVATLVAVINTANQCMTRAMCGLVMDPEPIPEVTFSTDGVPGFGNASVCSVVKDSELDGASNVRVTDISEEAQQRNISLFMPGLTVNGRMNCDDNRLNISFYHFMTFNYTIVFTKNDVTVIDPIFTMIYIAFNDLSPQGKITQTFTKFDPEKAARRGALLGDHYGLFMNGFYQSVFELASLNCVN